MSLSSHAGAYYMGGGSGGWWHGTDYSSWDSAQSWMPTRDEWPDMWDKGFSVDYDAFGAGPADNWSDNFHVSTDQGEHQTYASPWI